MDINVLMEYCNAVTTGICLCVGFMLKPWKKIPNKAIPTIMGILGIVIMVWINQWKATPEIILAGLISGLASTGLYEAFKKLIGGGKND